MVFTLIGFDHKKGARQFAFRQLSPDRAKSTVVVSADLELARRYDIPVQSLPLICTQILEAADASAVAHGFVSVTEEHMWAANQAAREQAAASKKKRTPPDAAPTLAG